MISPNTMYHWRPHIRILAWNVFIEMALCKHLSEWRHTSFFLSTQVFYSEPIRSSPDGRTDTHSFFLLCPSKMDQTTSMRHCPCINNNSIQRDMSLQFALQSRGAPWRSPLQPLCLQPWRSCLQPWCQVSSLEQVVYGPVVSSPRGWADPTRIDIVIIDWNVIVIVDAGERQHEDAAYWRHRDGITCQFVESAIINLIHRWL